MPTDGGSLQQVTHFPESSLFVEEPTIAPDGRYLVLQPRQRGLFVMAADDRRRNASLGVTLAPACVLACHLGFDVYVSRQDVAAR